MVNDAQPFSSSADTSTTYAESTPLTLSNFLRGGVAGCTAKVMVYPFDRLKMIYQIRGAEVGRFGFRSFSYRIQQVVHQEGVTSLWKGNLTALGKTFPHSAIVFFSFDAYYNRLAKLFPESLPVARLLAGGCAGLTATACTYPFDVWNTRMAISYGRFNYRQIIRIPTENFRSSLLRGFFPTAIGIFPYAGVSFLCFETMKSIIIFNKQNNQNLQPNSGRTTSKDEISVLQSMVCGGIAGVVSQSATYPLDTVRKVLQANYFLRHFQQGGYCSRFENPTMRQVFREIFQASGFRGFYNGLSLNWVKGFAAAAIAFTLNDKLKPF